MENVSKYERLLRMISDRFSVDIEELEAKTRFRDDLDADSLDVIEVIIALEQAFSIEIPLENINKKLTIGQMAELCGAEIGGMDFDGSTRVSEED